MADITGTNGNDLLDGTSDDDKIKGEDGNDTIFGFDGNDEIEGGAGDDLIDAGLGDDDVEGDDGNDTIFGDAGKDKLYGGLGDDEIHGGLGDDDVEGDDGNDTLFGDAGKDKIRGGLGNDEAYGGAGDDDVKGEDGNDTLFGDAGEDKVEGGEGDDELHGGGDDDELDGGEGNDTLFGDGGNDKLDAGKGDDEARGGDGNDDIKGDDGNDTLFGDAGEDSIDGGKGADEIHGGADNDDIQGGDGNDTIDGGEGDDKLKGENDDDEVAGGDGNDTIDGGSGNDTVTGGAGDDEIKGGGDDDVAVFDGSIVDFTLMADGSDVIVSDQNTADGDEGTDTVDDDVEFLQFDDYTLDRDGGNNAPVSLVGEETTDEDSVLDFVLTTIDFDGDDIDPPVVTVTGNNSSTSAGTIAVIGAGVLTPGYSGLGQSTDFNLQFDPGAGYQYLAAGETTTETVTVTSTDEFGASFTQTFDIVITGVNDAPVAADDSGVGFETNEDTAVLTASVLANDTDVDASDVLSVAALDTTGTVGSVTDNSDGTFTYDPNGQFEYLAVGESTTDTFSYTVSDGNGGTDTATVTITINGVNDAPVAADDSGAGFETDEDNSVTTASVLANDTDVDASDILSVSAVDATSAGGGLVTDNGNGTFNYNPNGQFESLAVGESTTDTFSYTVSDGKGGTDTATVTITINGVNDAPVAADDSGAGFETDEESSVTTASVLANDTDVDASDVLFVSALDTTGTSGLVTNNNDGTFSYDPNGQFESLALGESTTDTFSYTVSDGKGGTNSATVTVTINGINDDPVGVDDGGAGFATSEDDSFTTGNVLTNDTDVDTTDTLTVSAFATTGTVGLVTNNGDGTFEYDPNGQFEGLAVGETATDTFSYTVSDGKGGTDTATVTITIDGANDAPTAVGEIATTLPDNAVDINVLGNDSDPDGDSLTVFSLVQPENGTVTESGGIVTYTPDAGFVGVDGFSYTISDGNGGFDTAAVSVTVDTPPTGNTPPVALEGLIVAEADEGAANILTIDFNTLTVGGLPIISDAQQSIAQLDITSLELANDGRGSAEFVETSPGSNVFTVDLDEFGVQDGSTAQFKIQYTVDDGQPTNNTASNDIILQVTNPSGVPGNNPPVAADAMLTQDEDDGDIVVTLLGTGGLATDPDVGDTLTITEVLITDNVGNVIDLDVNPTSGEVTLIGGVLTINPVVFGLADTETGTFFVNYTVSDGEATDTGVVTINLTGSNINTAPTAEVGNETRSDPDDVITFDGPDRYEIDLGLLVDDVDGDPITIGVTSVLDGNNDPVPFTLVDDVVSINLADIALAAGETDDLVITYTASDGIAPPVTSTVNLTVNGPPVVGTGAGVVDFEDVSVDPGFAIPTDSIGDFRVDGTITVLEVDEMVAINPGRVAPGLIAGETTIDAPGEGTAAQIEGTLTEFDGTNPPEYSFTVYAPGATVEIGEGPVTVSFGQDPSDFFGPGFDLESLSLTALDGPDITVTIIPYRIEETSPGQYDYVEVGSFEVTVSSTTAGLLDFNSDFTDALNTIAVDWFDDDATDGFAFDDPETVDVEHSAFDNIVAVRIVTTGETILSDPGNPSSELIPSNDDQLVIDDFVFNI